MALNRELDGGNYVKDNLYVDIHPDNRWGHVRYGGEVINAKVICSVLLLLITYFT